MKKLILTIMTLAAATFCCGAQDMYVTSAKGNVNLRTAPSTSAPKCGSLTTAELLPVEEEVDGWFKVSLNGKTAYVSNTVAATYDAVIPKEVYNVTLTSNGARDRIRFQGSLEIAPVDRTHVLVTVNWMRLNLPAETVYYLADVREGRITATYSGTGYVEPTASLSSIKAEMSELSTPIPLGYSEFNNGVYFDGAEFSEFE